MKLLQLLGIALCAGTMALVGCGDGGTPQAGNGGANKKIMLGMISKSVSNPVFQAAHQGHPSAGGCRS
jgi:hypothetical protein